jgi:hypothetical protein
MKTSRVTAALAVVELARAACCPPSRLAGYCRPALLGLAFMQGAGLRGVGATLG